DHNLANDRNRAGAELAGRDGDVRGLVKRAQGLSVKARWEAKNTDYRHRRTQALRKLFEKRRELLSEPNKGLDFPSQLSSALRRCERDYSDGLEQAIAAQRGLELIFGYKSTLPAPVEHAVGGGTDPGMLSRVLDESLKWARNA